MAERKEEGPAVENPNDNQADGQMEKGGMGNYPIVIIWSLVSIGMMAWNKLAVRGLPMVASLVIIQNVATLAILMAIPSVRGAVAPLERTKLMQWLPVSLLFVAMLVTSLQSLVFLSVSTVLIFRNLGNLVAAVLEYFVLGKPVNTNIVLSLFTILGGVYLYGTYNEKASHGKQATEAEVKMGLFWVLVNLIVQCIYNVYVKWTIDTLKIDLTMYGKSYYNNLLSIPMLLIVALFRSEFTDLPTHLPNMTSTDWFWVVWTCPLAYGISTTGFKVQAIVSATTFTVLNNLNKVLVIVGGVMFMGDHFSNFWDVTGCAISLAGGAWYGWERRLQGIREKEAKEAESNANSNA